MEDGLAAGPQLAEGILGAQGGYGGRRLRHPVALVEGDAVLEPCLDEGAGAWRPPAMKNRTLE